MRNTNDHCKGRNELMNALLLCNGEPPGKTLCRRLARDSDFIVAADGGANIARRYGIRPHLIIGDLDSVTPSTRQHFASVPTIRVKRQDNTDLEKALDELVRRKAVSVTILGATGRRIDFTLGNLSVLWSYTEKLDIIVAGASWKAYPMRKRFTLNAGPGTIVSLIPFGRCSGITLSGLRYPLRNADMPVGHIGASNVVTRSAFSVRVERGRMLVIVFDDLHRRPR